MVIPHEDGDVRTFRVSYTTVRLFFFAILCIAVGIAILIVHQKRLVSLAVRAAYLEEENEELLRKNAIITELAGRMDRFEELYQQIGDMLGTGMRLSGELEEGAAQGETQALLEGDSRLLNEAGKIIPGKFSSEGTFDEEWSRPSSWPVPLNGYITRRFSMASEKHKGIDIAVPRNTPVMVTADGVVAEARYDPVYGNYVLVEHGNGFSTLYAHNSRLCVTKNQKVKKNEVIAFTGNTGASTAPHLHYELRKRNVPIDPQPFLR